MDGDSTFPAPTAGSQDFNLFQVLGGADTCRKLAVAFYAHIEQDPVLRPLYPPTLKGCPIKALSAYFVQFFGGPCEYAPRRWSLSLYEAHLRFKIGPSEREAWLKNMRLALEDVRIEEPARRALLWYFERASAFLVNRPQASADEAVCVLNRSPEDENELPTDCAHQEIARRWETQHTLMKQLLRPYDESSALRAKTESACSTVSSR